MDENLHDRIVALEQQVADLQQKVRSLVDAPRTPRAPARPKSDAPFKPRARKTRERVDKGIWVDIKSGAWAARIGIALVLIGLALLFKYSIDEGWLGPNVRVGFGVVLGTILLGFGLRLAPRRIALGHVLLGGSVATYFVTIFAAYHFYSLLGYPLAFLAMALVSVGTFYLSFQQRGAVLGLIATLGGLGTPFLLQPADGSIPGLVAYLCFVLALAAAIYTYRGWRSLVWVAAIGGWISFVPAISMASSGADRWTVQAGLLLSLLAFGVLPVLRDRWHKRDSTRWPVCPMRQPVWVLDRPALTLAVLAPLVVLSQSQSLWSISADLWAAIAGVGAMAAAAAYIPLRREQLPRLASSQAMAAALLLVTAWMALADDYWEWYLLVATEAAALHLLARRLQESPLRVLAHFLSLIVVMSLSARVLGDGGSTPVLVHGQALVDLAVVALLTVGAWTLATTRLRNMYCIVAYLGFLGWLWRDLSALPSGQAYVSIAWGACALLLLATGWRISSDVVRTAGLLTLVAVVAKLFLVDLGELDAVWRILLFLGFGGLLLVLGYLFPSLWKSHSVQDAPT